MLANKKEIKLRNRMYHVNNHFISNSSLPVNLLEIKNETIILIKKYVRIRSFFYVGPTAFLANLLFYDFQKHL